MNAIEDRPSRRWFLKGLLQGGIYAATGSIVVKSIKAFGSLDDFQFARPSVRAAPVVAEDTAQPPTPVHPRAARHLPTTPFDWIGCYPKTGLPRNDGRKDQPLNNPDIDQRFVSYLHRRREILSPNSVIVKTDSPTEIEWQKMLGTVATMDDRLAQVNTIFRWIKANIDYDYDKNNNLTAADLKWFRAPQDTLRTKKGVCIDQALLAMESLHLIGFAKQDITVQSMLVFNLDGTPRMRKDGPQEAHAVLGLNIDGNKYVMDLTDRVGIWHEAKYYWPGGITGGEIMKPYEANNFNGTTYYQKNFVGPRPLTAEQEKLPALLYSSDDRQKYESIPGLPALQPYELKNGPVTRSAVRANLNQVIMTSPSSGCIGTGCSF